MFLNLGCNPCLQSLFIWAIYRPLDDNVRTVLISLYILFTSVSDPWNFGMYPDPYLWPTDPAPAPDPALFVSDLQDANKTNYFLSKPTSFAAKYGKNLRFPTVKGKGVYRFFLQCTQKNINIPALAFPPIFVPFPYSGLQIKKYAVVNSTLS